MKLVPDITPMDFAALLFWGTLGLNCKILELRYAKLPNIGLHQLCNLQPLGKSHEHFHSVGASVEKKEQVKQFVQSRTANI